MPNEQVPEQPGTLEVQAIDAADLEAARAVMREGWAGGRPGIVVSRRDLEAALARCETAEWCVLTLHASDAG